MANVRLQDLTPFLQFSFGFSQNVCNLLGLGIVAMLLWTTLPALAVEKENHKMSSDSLEQRGKQLRAELERTYRELKRTNRLGMGNGPGVDVSQIIETYIPLGTSFDEAEQVLQTAGFHMAARPPRPMHREPAPEWEKALRFTMGGGLELDKAFGYRADVGVTLYPDAPGDPGARVKQIISSIQTTYL